MPLYGVPAHEDYLARQAERHRLQNEQHKILNGLTAHVASQPANSRSQPMRPESVQVMKVMNGWVITPVPEPASMGYSTFHNAVVARTPEELVKVIYQFATGEDMKGFPLHDSSDSRPG